MLVPVGAAVCLLPWTPAAAALALGAVIALSFGNAHSRLTSQLTPRLLAFSIVGLGAGMDLRVVGRVGMQGFGYTLVGISGTFALGFLLRRLLHTPRDTSLLLTSGTAICGGSAIAAVSSAIQAKEEEISVSLAIVFLLNAVGLFLFPPIGHWLSLSQTQFGLWSALAIHDTSSVVGAGIAYGPEALSVGTTVKLARALWIAPVTLAISLARGGWKPGTKIRRPWFVLGFLVAAATVTWVPDTKLAGDWVANVAKRLLVVTLFLIGTGLTRKSLATVGLRPLVQAVTLWIIIATLVLAAILAGWIH